MLTVCNSYRSPFPAVICKNSDCGNRAAAAAGHAQNAAEAAAGLAQKAAAAAGHLRIFPASRIIRNPSIRAQNLIRSQSVIRVVGDH